jgi:hypothetical protein
VGDGPDYDYYGSIEGMSWPGWGQFFSWFVFPFWVSRVSVSASVSLERKYEDKME